MSKEFEYMKEALAVDLADFLIRDFGVTTASALSILYNSDTYSKLCNPLTGLYYQSPGYVYSFLKTELDTGQMY